MLDMPSMMQYFGRMETIYKINERYHQKLQEIRNLSLAQWVTLANKLQVALNDREHAAKKLALRELKAEGAI